MTDHAGINGLAAETMGHLDLNPVVWTATATICERWLKAGQRGIGQDLVWIALVRLETRGLVSRRATCGEVNWSLAAKHRASVPPLPLAAAGM